MKQERKVTANMHFVVSRDRANQYQTTLDGRWLRAIHKAQELRARCWKCGSRYRVHSASDRNLWHYLSQNADGSWRCDCQGYEYTGLCWHLGSLQLRLWREYRPPRLADFEATPYDLFEEPDIAA